MNVQCSNALIAHRIEAERSSFAFGASSFLILVSSFPGPTALLQTWLFQAKRTAQRHPAGSPSPRLNPSIMAVTSALERLSKSGSGPSSASISRSNVATDGGFVEEGGFIGKVRPSGRVERFGRNELNNTFAVAAMPRRIAEPWATTARMPPFHALRADLALPSSVRGPVDFLQGPWVRMRAACFRRDSGVQRGIGRRSVGVVIAGCLYYPESLESQ